MPAQRCLTNLATIMMMACSSSLRQTIFRSCLVSATSTAFVNQPCPLVQRHRHASSAKSVRRPHQTSKASSREVQRWKSPLFGSTSPSSERSRVNRISPSQPALPSGDATKPQRPPRLYKRTVLYGKSSGDTESNRVYRADRVLANRTGKSRKECFQLLQEGRVFQVVSHQPNGEETSDTDVTESARRGELELVSIRGPSAKLAMNTELRIDKHQIVPLPPPLLAIYYKPKWVLSVRSDPMGRPCLDNVFTNHGTTSSGQAHALHPVGRLDYDTTGLLLFSSSGALTQALLHPKHAIEKEYVATVTGVVDEDALRATLSAGVTTGEGVHTAQLLSVAHMPSTQVTDYLAAIQSELPAVYNTTDLKLRGYLDIFDATDLSTVTLTVSEGKHRMVRRMLANTGHPVVSLHRARIGAIRLDDDAHSPATAPVLRPGQTRSLTPLELRWVQQQLKLKGPTKKDADSTENAADDELLD